MRPTLPESLGSDCTQLSPEALRVAGHYQAHVLEYEAVRLEQDSPVEYGIMRRVLAKRIEPGSRLADIGVGVGHYAEFLARRGCQLHLVDIVASFLEQSRKRLQAAGLGEQIASSTLASPTDLSFLSSGSLDAVLMLGPLYHLPQQRDRIQALSEAHRVLKPGGLLLASAINRLAAATELFRSERFFQGQKTALREIYPSLKRNLEDGKCDAQLFPALGTAFLSTPALLRSEIQPLFDEVELRGLESFSAFQQQKLHRYEQEEQELWLELLESSGLSTEGIAASEHLLMVATRRDTMVQNLH